MRYVAIDSETCLIGDRLAAVRHKDDKEFSVERLATRAKGAIYLEPMPIPDLVLGSVCNETLSPRCLPRGGLMRRVAIELNDPDVTTIWHNLAFDYHVLCKADPSLRPLFWAAAAGGRIVDTMYLSMLVGLAEGRYDKRRPPSFGREDLQPESLDVLTRRHTNLVLDKDERIRLGYGQFMGVWPVPDDFRVYAEQDALATYLVGMKLLEKAGPTRLGLKEQIECVLVVADMDQRGVRIDREEARRLRAIFEKDVPALRDQLVAAGLALWRHKTGSIVETRVDLPVVDMTPAWYLDGGRLKRTKLFKTHAVLQVAEPEFGVKQAEVRAQLQELVNDLPEEAPRTPTGLLSLDHEFWKQYLPPDNTGLLAWAQHEKLQKIIGTYLRLYGAVDVVFPRWNVLGARSGRMSASSSNLQNLPKRKHGIRSLIIPPKDKVFVVADYSAEEVYTLCEAMIHLGIKGPLFDVLSTKADIHRLNAGRMLGKLPEDVTKDERQLAKVLVFGVGGGLGPKKLADTATRDYGLPMTKDAAKEAKARFLEVFWDIDRFLKHVQMDFNDALIKVSERGIGWWKRELGVEGWILDLKRAFLKAPPEIKKVLFDAEQMVTVRLPTGQVRANCTFTEGANTYFQGLGAAVTKHAAFLAARAGLDVTMLVHDEIVIECEPLTAAESGATLEQCMLQAFRDICPNVGPFAKVETTCGVARWGVAKDKNGSAI